MSNFLTIVGAAPLKKPVTPLTWTKIQVGTGDGFTIDSAMNVTPNTTVGNYISSSSFSASADAGADGGSYRIGNANNRSIQIVVDNVVGFRAYGYGPFDTAATLVDVFVNFDGNLANRHGQVTFDGPVAANTQLYEVTGLARGKHAFMLRENGAGWYGVDYFEYQS